VPTSAGGPYSAAYYNDKPTLASADVLTVTAPTPRSDINDTLSRGLYLPLVQR
jgi:hypothetical protein